MTLNDGNVANRDYAGLREDYSLDHYAREGTNRYMGARFGFPATVSQSCPSRKQIYNST